MAEPKNARKANFSRAHVRQASYIAAGILLFAIFLIARFPYSDAASVVLAPAGLGLKSTDQHVRFPFGAELYEVRLVSLESPSATLLQSERVRLTPSLGSLFLVQKSFDATTTLYSGDLNVSARRADERTLVAFELKALNLAENRELSASGASLAGRLFGSGNLALASGGSISESSDLAFRATGMKLMLNGEAEPLSFGDVSARLKLVDGALKLEELKSTGGDLVLDGKGTIRPVAEWTQSPIDLTVKIRLSPDARSRLQFLNTMLPYPPGDQPYQISGTVGAPVFLGSPPSPKRPRVESTQRTSPGGPIPVEKWHEDAVRLMQETLAAHGMIRRYLPERSVPEPTTPPPEPPRVRPQGSPTPGAAGLNAPGHAGRGMKADTSDDGDDSADDK